MDYGRLAHPTLRLPLGVLLDQLLTKWAGVDVGTSPGWRHQELIDLLSRLPDQGASTPLILMQHPDGGPRQREWDPELGFINLLQGADPVRRQGQPWYPGDRAVGGVTTNQEQVVVQVHRVKSTQAGLTPEVFTLAIHAGRRGVIRKV